MDPALRLFRLLKWRISQEGTFEIATDTLYLQPNRGVSSDLFTFSPANCLPGEHRDLVDPLKVLT